MEKAESRKFGDHYVFRLFVAHAPTYVSRQYDALRTHQIGRQLSVEIFGQNVDNILEVQSETCFYFVLQNTIEVDEFLARNTEKLQWLLAENPFHVQLTTRSFFDDLSLKEEKSPCFCIEIGPRLSMTTPFSTNAVSAFASSGIHEVIRIERSHRYQIRLNRRFCDKSDTYLNVFFDFISGEGTTFDETSPLFDCFGDRMTQCRYSVEELPQLDVGLGAVRSSNFSTIDVLDSTNGEANLRRADAEMALGFDADDFRFYLDFFRLQLRRNPTDVELFDLAQSNSEHSRHWFFRGRIRVDGRERGASLFKIIQQTQHHSNPNNVIAFSDNSSAIRGFHTTNLLASQPGCCARLSTVKSLRHIVYTAETHNFPTGVCPFPGAATGVGGRIRDVHATGRGAHEIAGVAGYSVGNLQLSGFSQPWEYEDWSYPTRHFAAPAKILLEASDGASDYGNKFGEPLICGFTRTFGGLVPKSSGVEMERVEYIKPIMFSGGVGSIDDAFLFKEACAPGQLVAKLGGPVYRIGVGGGAASSCAVQGTRATHIDFGAVQRGDPEMEQKVRRVVRGCVELGRDANPVLSIHDQGAGGNGNVLKEIVEGDYGGAIIYSSAFELGDPTITLRELWGAEYQESDALLIDSERLADAERIARRERCTLSVVGRVTGDQRIVLKDYETVMEGGEGITLRSPVDLDLRLISEREPKTFDLVSEPSIFDHIPSLQLPKLFTVFDALLLVLRLPTVASKRFLTSKVDRSVSGLVAQQQCVGPFHTPLADVAVTALSYWDCCGAAVACGEQPLKGIAVPSTGARMSVGEALTNLVFAPITCIEDVKCSGNWMWAAKLTGEGARLVAACDAMCEVMNRLGVAVDGGKDSLSMAASVPTEDGTSRDVVKAPGTLVVSAYAPCVDVTRVVTPDWKPREGTDGNAILHLRFAANAPLPINTVRCGGTALAQCLKQIGGPEAPDLDDAEHFKKCFCLVQSWIHSGRVVSGHDVSDGGLLIALLEGAFAGNCSLECNFHLGFQDDVMSLKWLFSEELGVLLEVNDSEVASLLKDAEHAGVSSALSVVGRTRPVFGAAATAKVLVDGRLVLDGCVSELREIWEETSDRMESLQLPQSCVAQQADWRRSCNASIDGYFCVNFDYSRQCAPLPPLKSAPFVAILREEGSNGDREMSAAFMMAGFQAFDLTMSDLLESSSSATGSPLRFCRGLAFVGGFSYADVLGSARGWAAAVRFNRAVRRELDAFRRRVDTFSLGVCNGCQLMALLGFIGEEKESDKKADEENVRTTVFLDENESGRFYSGFNVVRIERSPCVLLRDMAESTLGVWCSHGEGRFTYADDATLELIQSGGLACIRYCDAETGRPTMVYPENPNGSRAAVAGVCSADGRHLAMMPHPDRSFLRWQCPVRPREDDGDTSSSPALSPWIRLFQNAFEWTTQPDE